MDTYEAEARLKLLASLGVLEALGELRAGFSEPDPVGKVKPVEFYEITGGGRWDGSYQLIGECTRCGSQVSHIITRDMLEAPDSADVYARIAHCMCEAYELPRPMVPKSALFSENRPYFPSMGTSPVGFGFGEGGLN